MALVVECPTQGRYFEVDSLRDGSRCRGEELEGDGVEFHEEEFREEEFHEEEFREEEFLGTGLNEEGNF